MVTLLKDENTVPVRHAVVLPFGCVQEKAISMVGSVAAFAMHWAKG